MNAIALLKEQALKAARPHELHDIMVSLSKFGKVRVGQYGSEGRWSCTVDMHVSVVGVSFEVNSGFDNTTPLQAAVKCMERVVEAFSRFGK